MKIKILFLFSFLFLFSQFVQAEIIGDVSFHMASIKGTGGIHSKTKVFVYTNLPIYFTNLQKDEEIQEYLEYEYMVQYLSEFFEKDTNFLEKINIEFGYLEDIVEASDSDDYSQVVFMYIDFSGENHFEHIRTYLKEDYNLVFNIIAEQKFELKNNAIMNVPLLHFIHRHTQKECAYESFGDMILSGTIGGVVGGLFGFLTGGPPGAAAGVTGGFITGVTGGAGMAANSCGDHNYENENED